MQAYSCYIPKTYRNNISLLPTKNYFVKLSQNTAFFKQSFNPLLSRRNSLGMREQTNVKLAWLKLSDWLSFFLHTAIS